jgi:homoserine O-acetyltransferase/O-succinyltransferase
MNETVHHAEHIEREFALELGGSLPEARAAYLTLGQLNADRSNAILIAHGYTSSHTFVLPASTAAEGSWSGLIGPGCAIDTDRYFVVASNALGSCHGTTGPASINPASGLPWGPDFPRITFSDIVRLQRWLLGSLGIVRLRAVVGVSMGGFQALQWGVQYPDAVERIGAVLTHVHGRSVAPTGTEPLLAQLATTPGWNGGRFAPGAMQDVLVRMRMGTLQRYGMEKWLEDDGLDPDSRASVLNAMSTQWAKSFDANSMVTLLDAIQNFDVTGKLSALCAKVLLVLSTSDALFPANEGPAIAALLESHGVDVEFHALQSAYGHLASGLDWRRWDEPLRRLVD